MTLRKLFVFLPLILFALSCNSDQSISDEIQKLFPALEFSISSSKDTTLFGKQGTRLFIEKGSFEFEDGSPVNGPIDIQLKEFYKKSDMVLADLSCISNGMPLETGGMLNIQASADGKPLTIKKGKSIVVHFPKTNKSFEFNRMNLFYASENGADSSPANWNIDTASLIKAALKISSFTFEWPDYDDSTEFHYVPKGEDPDSYNAWFALQLCMDSFKFSESTINEVSANETVNIDYVVNKKGKITNCVIKEKLSNQAKQEILAYISSLPEFIPGKNNKGNIIERKCAIEIGIDRIPLYKSKQEYAASFDKKYSEFEKQPIRSMNDAELEYYIFNVSKLGWINCDRFLEDEKRIDYVVDVPAQNNTKLKMIFKEIAGVLMAEKKDGKYIFKQVPLNKQVTIVAIKDEKGSFKIAFHPLTITEAPLKSLDFRETSLEELRTSLERLN